MIVDETGPWKEKIIQNALLFLKSGMDLTPENLNFVKKKINSLPWVDHCKLIVKGKELQVEIWEEPIDFSLFYKGSVYLIGKNGFIVGRRKDRFPGVKIYFYRGKSPPFTLKDSFLKLKDFVKIETNLVRKQIEELGLRDREIQIILTDTGIVLILSRLSALVYLSFDSNSWENFHLLLSKGFIKPGVYDLRYSDLLVVKGRKENDTSQKLNN